MNILLWILQIVLALFALSGGAYKVFGFDAVASTPFYGDLPRAGWSLLGVFEMVAAILLIVPTAARWLPVLTPIAAAALALESLALAGLYARHSMALTAENPMVWVVVMAVLAVAVALGRLAR